MEDTFKKKSTSTLLCRGYAILGYIGWAASRVKGRLLPVREADAYRYTCYLADTKAAATKAASFVQAMGFAWGVIRLDDADRVANSQRIGGAAQRSYVKKRLTKQRRALSKAMLEVFERGAHSEDPVEAVLAGTAAFLSHTRSRFEIVKHGDSEPFLDIATNVSGSVHGFIE